MSTPAAYFLELDWPEVSHAYRRAGLANVLESAPHALARSIAASPGWRDYPPGVVVLRPGPPPLLGIVFADTIPDVPSLEARARHLPMALDLLRFRSWDQVVRDVKTLADALSARLTQHEILRARWTPIPRGGGIVFGLLSYVLGLRRESLVERAPPDEAAPIVLVDDCILSGRRLGEYLRALDPDRRVVVATLFSAPALREALKKREPQVLDVCSANDLEDRTAALLGEHEQDWRRRWHERSGPEPYWIGLPEQVCFPWNEPDMGVWNGEKEVVAWRLLPPDVCLKNQPRRGDSLEVEVMETGSGYLAPGPDVLAASIDGSVVVAERKRGRSLTLSGTAAEMWQRVTAEPSRKAATETLARLFAAGEDEIGSDLEGFEGQLIALGLLERRG